MNEEDKKNLIGKCNLTFDEDEGHYITDGIMTEVSDTLQDVVILNNIDGKVVLCFTVCELTNTFTGKMTAVYRQQIWENGCFTHVLNRIPSSNELVNAEHFYELVARRRYNTFGFVRYRKVAIAANGAADENLHYIFPMPRSVILSDKPLSHGDDQIFYHDGNRVNITQQKDGVNMWTENYGQRVVTDTLTELTTDGNLRFYVQTDIFELFKCRYYNRFNLVRMNKIMIGNSAQNLTEAHLFLICPSNNDTLTTSHVPIEEMKECPEMSEAQIQAARNAIIARANNEFIQEELGGDNEAMQQIQAQELAVQRWQAQQIQEQEQEQEQVVQRWQNQRAAQRMQRHQRRIRQLDLLRQQLLQNMRNMQPDQLLQIRQQIRQLHQERQDDMKNVREEEAVEILQPRVLPLQPDELARRVIQQTQIELRHYNEEEVDDIHLPARIQDMQPNNEEIVRRFGDFVAIDDDQILLNQHISDLFCLYIRGHLKSDNRVLETYKSIISDISTHRVERLNAIDNVLQRLLESPIPNVIKAIAKASVERNDRYESAKSNIGTAIEMLVNRLPPVLTIDELEFETYINLGTLYQYDAMFSGVHKYLLHKDNWPEYSNTLIQETLEENQRKREEADIHDRARRRR